KQLHLYIDWDCYMKNSEILSKRLKYMKMRFPLIKRWQLVISDWVCAMSLWDKIKRLQHVWNKPLHVEITSIWIGMLLSLKYLKKCRRQKNITLQPMKLRPCPPTSIAVTVKEKS